MLQPIGEGNMLPAISFISLLTSSGHLAMTISF